MLHKCGDLGGHSWAYVRKALEDAGLDAAKLTHILTATCTPDHLSPSLSCIIGGNIGAGPAMSFDFGSACSGFLYGLHLADALLCQDPASQILFVCTEALTRRVNWSDRSTCVLFGDGAGAVVLRASDTPGILATDLHADGRHLDILCVPGTVSGGRISGVPLLRMDGQAVFKLAVGVLEKTARASLEKAGRTEADIDWLIPHQANIRIMQGTARKLKLPLEKVIVTVDQHGNTSAASIPLALDAGVRDGRIRRGETLLLEGVGGGFTWGSVLLDF